ncbi:CcdC protein domain-containing protein [Novosphingobium sp.]|uniref:CcdC protein domain-containing protein n=1 Tax=Novosphingobium sp. TaxID=1874826 RepID=UPI0025FE2218|nr:CcdC protein domain-containing protein [Novosphingobium sp.]
MNPQHSQGLAALIPYAVIALVLAIRLRRVGKTRPLRLWAVWLLPAIYAVFAIGLLATMPPHGVGWLWCALALAAGSAIGWQRGRMMRIVVDPATGTLQQSQSLAGVLFLVALVAARSFLRQETMTDARHVTALATGVLVSFALGVIAVQRLEMAIRARRLLQAA